MIRFDALRQRDLLTPFGVDNANQGDLLIALSVMLGVVLLAGDDLGDARFGTRQRGDALDAPGRARTSGWNAPASSEAATKGRSTCCTARTRRAPRIGSDTDALDSATTSALRYGVSAARPGAVRYFTRAVRNLRVPRRVETRKPDATVGQRYGASR